MALDHFVPQVHLRRFVSPVLGNRLYAIRKRDAFRFTPRTKDVCRIEKGSTNDYLTEPRAIEEFLKDVEPKYNAAVDALVERSSDAAHVRVVAAFVAYVASCSPTAMRLFTEPLRAVVKATAAIMEAHGRLPPAPASLKGASLTDLLRHGTVQIKIDRKYPQAIGIAQILELVRMFEAFDWEILHSPSRAKPFLTSDYPVGVEERGRPLVNRIVPLSPELAVRLVPGSTALTRTRGTSVAGARSHRVATGHEAVDVNRTIIRCAESTVFFRDDAPWVVPFVETNRSYRVAALARDIPSQRGSVLVSSIRVEKRTSDGEA